MNSHGHRSEQGGWWRPETLQALHGVTSVLVILGGGLYGTTSLDRTAALDHRIGQLENAVHEYHRRDEITREVDRRLTELFDQRSPAPP